MEKMASTRKVDAIILVMTFVLATLPSFGFNKPELAYAAQTDQSSLTPSETIYLSTFISYSSEAVVWDQNLYFDFNNTIGIPFNMSMPAFDQHFQSADYSLAQGTSWDQYLMMLTVSFDAINVDLAENWTDEICNQFQQAFNLNLSITDSWHEVNNSTGYITVYRRLGYIHLDNTIQDAPAIEELVKYKPEKGFGQLINPDFVDHWLSSPSRGGVGYLEYTLKRVDQNVFSWRFLLSIEPSSGDISGNGAHLNIDFDDLLNHTGSIVPSGQGLSKIQLDIKNFVVNEYNMTLESIAPQYTSKENEGGGDILVTYNLTSPVNNIVAAINITRLEGTNNFSWTNAAVATALLLGLAASCLIYIRRRRRLGKRAGSEKTVGQEVR
jgi:hypothetical protein